MSSALVFGLFFVVTAFTPRPWAHRRLDLGNRNSASAMTYQTDDKFEDVTKQQRMLLLRALVKAFDEMQHGLCSNQAQVKPFGSAWLPL